MSEVLTNALWIALFVAVTAAMFAVMIAHYSHIRRRGQRDYAALAEHFGFRPAERSQAVGSAGGVTGMLDGHEALIAPDSHGKLRVRLKRPIACALSTGVLRVPSPEGSSPFDFAGDAWNLLFPSRQASPAMAEWLRGQERTGSALHRFLERWVNVVRSRRDHSTGMEIGPEQLTCTPLQGSRVKPRGYEHVRFDEVRALLPDLVALAAAIDAEAPRDEAGAGQPPADEAPASGGLVFEVEE